MNTGRDKFRKAIELSEETGWEVVKGMLDYNITKPIYFQFSSFFNFRTGSKLGIDKDNVTLWKKDNPDGGISIFKRYMEVNTSLENVLAFFTDNKKVMSVNDKLVKNDTIEEINKHTRIMRREMKGNLIVSNRDLALFWEIVKLNDGSVVIISFSIVTDKVPETKCVRAEQDINIMHFNPITDSK